MKISVIQTGLPNGAALDGDMEQSRKASDKALNKCFELLEQAYREGAELAVTPEMINMIINYRDERYIGVRVLEGLDGPAVERFSRFAKEKSMHIVAGLGLTLDGKPYNCGVLFNQRGEIVGVHKKVHMPNGEEMHITPGNEFKVFKTDIGNIGMLICWDLEFPEAVAELALGGADLLACPTMGWMNFIGLVRAYDHNVHIAAAMGAGDSGVSFLDPSCIVDNMGQIICAAERRAEQTVTADVDLTKEPPNIWPHIDASSRRMARLIRRAPEAYRLINKPVEETPLYKRYYG